MLTIYKVSIILFLLSEMVAKNLPSISCLSRRRASFVPNQIHKKFILSYHILTLVNKA